MEKMHELDLGTIIDSWLTFNAIPVIFSKVKMRPRPKARPRFKVRGKWVETYHIASDFEKAIAEVCSKVADDTPELTTAIFFRAKYFLYSPSIEPGKPFNLAPDIDNVDKAVLDSLKSILRDDAVVVKKYSEKIATARHSQRAEFSLHILKRGAPV